MNYLIINADDFGLCESVNDSILELFLDKKITSFTFMVNMYGSKDAVKKLNELKIDNIPVGLHFNIVRGKSLIGKSTLTDQNGYFLGRNKLFKKILLGKVKKLDIKSEALAQLNFLKINGLNPSHIDSDNHSLSNPFVFNSLKNFIREEELNCRKILPLKFVNCFKKPKRFLQQCYLIGTNKINNYENIKSNDFITSIYDSMDNRIDANTYYNLLKTNKINSVIELMVHPYTKSKKLLEIYQKPNEINFLENCDKEFKILKDINTNNFNDYILTNFNFLSESE